MSIRMFAAAFAASLCVGVGAAWAVFTQPLVLTGAGASDIPVSQIRFELPSGQSVPVQEDDDGRLAIIFPGNGAEAGTLVLPGPGGGRRIAVPAAGPGQVLRVNVPAGTVALRPGGNGPGAPAGNVVAILGGRYAVDLGEFGAGANISAGESFAARHDGRVDGPSYGLAFRPAGIPGLTLYAATGDGHDRGATSIASGGDVVGLVYDDFSPSGSTGVNLGANGLDTLLTLESDYQKFGGMYDFPHDYLDDSPNILAPRISLFFTGVDTRAMTWVESPSFGAAITQSADRHIQQDFISLGLGMGFHTPSNPGWFFGAGADALAIYSKAELNSVQENICTLCGVQDRDFDIVIRQEESGWDLGLEATVEMGYRFDNGLSVGVLGALVYTPEMAGVWSTETGDDLFIDNRPTQLRLDSATNSTVQIFLAFGF